jgi:threonine dehydratase
MLMPTLDGIRRAAATIRPHLKPTPLLRSEILSRAFQADVWIKNESVSPISSFKLRGSLNALMRAGTIERAVTASTGNHGQAVAYAARLLKIPADIFLPENPNPVKRAMIQAFGATVHLAGTNLTTATEHAMKFPGFFVDDGENVDVVQGAGTAGLEIAEELSGIDAVFIPMGGGALAGGCATAIKSIQPQARVYSVQSKAAPAMTRSFHDKKPISVPANTLADGLVCGVPPTLTLNVLWKHLDDALLVEETDLLAGVHTLFAAAHVLAEPAGAAGLAGAWQKRSELRGRNVVLVLSGSNITDDLLKRSLDTRSFLDLAV